MTGKGTLDERGQATVEYLLAGIALLATIVALGALWRFASDGRLTLLADDAASHAIAAVGGVADALMF